MTVTIGRRSALTGAAALAAALRPGAARAASEVVVATWGGDYGQLLTENVERPLLTPQGIEAIQDINDQNARKTKLTAERAARRGSMDVVHLSDTDMFQMQLLGAFEPVSAGPLKNAANIVPALRKPYAVPHIISAQVIIYNPEKITTPPKGFLDLWDPRWRGRVAIPDLNFPSVTFGSALVAGGSMSNWEPARQKLLDLHANKPTVFASHEALAQAWKAEEVWIAPMWLARAFQWKKSGLKIAHVVPEEGAIPVVFEAAVTRNAQHKEAAWAYLDAMLDPRAQVGFADRMGYGPTVSNATLPGALQAQIGFTPEQQAKFRTPDYEYQARENPKILDFWIKEFKV